MTPTQLSAHIHESIAEVAPEADLASVDPERPLRPQLELDSMDFLRVVQALHRRTGVTIPEADYPRVATLSTLTNYLAKALVT